MNVHIIMLIVWVAIAVLFFIGEMVTEGFALMWFGIGAVAGALFVLLRLPIWSQILVAVAVSTVLFGLSRVFFKRVTRKASKEGVAADRMIGKQGVVIERIDPMTNKGMVRVTHEEWRADSIEGTPIESGAKVEVVRVEGVRLIVKVKEE